ncbi:energy transducer TonB [Pedobacter sp. SYP-B3415]|uniref:energy transducer TonB n=1 Tax=Pedobacter sp. SYP-B3415 TaxID=2496641 RepID=UPI00101BE527|nr:energy transducer TonB [Pedobacter sp. SYP-B3415]
MQYREENNYPKALAISTGVFIVFLAISFLYLIGTPFTQEQLGTGGVIVNFGTSPEGMGDDYTSIEEPSMAPNANGQMPDKVITEQETKPTPNTQASDKNVVTQDNEDAATVNTKDNKSNAAPNASNNTKPVEQTINQNALYKGKANKGMGRGDGTGSTPGNQGDRDGDPLATNYGEGGSGFGNKPIELRSFTNLVVPKDDGQKTGKIAVRIYINADGIVTNAQAGVKGTTLSDKALWEKCREAVMGATLTRSASGNNQQVGVVVFNFKVK